MIQQFLLQKKDPVRSGVTIEERPRSSGPRTLREALDVPAAVGRRVLREGVAKARELPPPPELSPPQLSPDSQ